MSILVIRPSPDGEQLVHALFSIGKLAYHFPLVYFSSGRHLFLLSLYLSLLSEGDFLFFVSKNAIQYAHYYLLNIGLNWPKNLMYYSIGRSTSLKMYSLSGILIKYPQERETSEDLLKFPELIYMRNRRALILKGNSGRTFLEKTLKKRGAYVLCCECYRRRPLQYNREKQCAYILSLNINTIVVTTGAMLYQLYYFIPKSHRFSWLIRCRLIVVSFRLQVLAEKFGWKDIIVARSACNSELLYTLIKYS